MTQAQLSRLSVCGCAGACILVVAWWTHAGDLTPPSGPVAPTMKSLAELEPRIAVNDANTPGDSGSLFRITVPGSYYLQASITGISGKHGIFIDADAVTLDLNGFGVRGIPGSLDGVHVGAGHVNIIIHDGIIQEWGQAGIRAASADICVAESLLVYQNGDGGLRLAPHSRIRACTVRANRVCGVVLESGSVMAQCVVADTVVDGSIGGDGIYSYSDSVISDCLVSSNGGDGIHLFGPGGSVVQCVVVGNLGHGIAGTDDCRITNNRVSTLPDAGIAIRVTGAVNHIEGNSIKCFGIAIAAEGTRSLIIRNTALGGSGSVWRTASSSAASPPSAA